MPMGSDWVFLPNTLIFGDTIKNETSRLVKIAEWEERWIAFCK